MFTYTSKEYRDEVKSKVNTRFFKYKKKTVLQFAHGKVLELGCGEIPIFKNSSKMDIAKIGDCIQADLNKPFPLKKKFDTIVALDLIGHLHNVDGFLKECHKTLNKSGTLILSSRNVLYWKSRLRLLFGNDKDFDLDGEYFWFFSPKSLTRKLEQHGFKLIFIHNIGRAHFLSLGGGFICVCSKVEKRTKK